MNPSLRVVFDTNAYRTLVHGLSVNDAENAIGQLRSREELAGIQAVASPYVMLELLAHLADRNDLAYADCLSAVCALQRHCEVDPANGQLAILGDAESQLARSLYDVTLEDHQQTTQTLAWTCLSIQQNPTEGHLDSIRSHLIGIRDWMQQAKSNFVNDMKSFVVQGFDPSATDWRPLQHDAGLRRTVLEHLNSEDALRELAQIFVLKAMLQAYGAVQPDPDFDRKVDLVVGKFSSPLRLYREVAKRIVMSGCDLTKKNRANWLWDIQIAFTAGAAGHTVGGQVLQLITNDKDIIDAAHEANADGSVVSLNVHLGRV
jgi:hypothetical protein